MGVDPHAWATVKRTNHLLIGADIFFANDTAKRPNPNTDSVGELLDSGCQRCKGCGTWLRWARICQLRHHPHQVGRYGNQDLKLRSPSHSLQRRLWDAQFLDDEFPSELT
jgi:hypothetical protein